MQPSSQPTSPPTSIPTATPTYAQYDDFTEWIVLLVFTNICCCVSFIALVRIGILLLGKFKKKEQVVCIDEEYAEDDIETKESIRKEPIRNGKEPTYNTIICSACIYSCIFGCSFYALLRETSYYHGIYI